MRLLVMYWPIIVLLSVIAVRVLQVKSRRAAAPEDGTSPLHWLLALNPIPLLLGLVSLAAGFGLSYATGVPSSLRGYLASRTWVATPCTILESKVESEEGSRSSKVASRLAIRYAYEIVGRRYQGNRYTFGFDGFTTGNGAQQLAATLPPGKATTCYVDPDQPDRAVVNKDFSRDLLTIIIPSLIFAGAGLGLLASEASAARSRMRNGEAEG